MDKVNVIKKKAINKKEVNKKVKRKSNNKRKWGGVDKGLLVVIIVMLCIGVTMIYSASSYYAMFENGSSTFFLKKILTWTIVGLIAMFVTMNIDYQVFKNGKFTIFIYSVTALALIYVRFFSKPINGAYRWIQIGPLSVQPSEIAKYVVILSIAYYMDRYKKNIRNFWSGPIAGFAIATGLAVWILVGRNLSVTGIVLGVGFIMVFVSGAKKAHTLPFIPLGMGLGYILMKSADYRWARFTSFLDPWKDPTGSSYQVIQSIYALGSGGITGVGLGESRQKMLFLPEPHNDFIFAVIGEEFGLIGCVILIALFMFIVYKGTIIANKAKDTYGFLIAIGITSVISLQAIINIAVVTSSMPVTGVPLPFISYGGTALVVNLAAMGILLNISRARKEDVPKKSH